MRNKDLVIGSQTRFEILTTTPKNLDALAHRVDFIRMKPILSSRAPAARAYFLTRAAMNVPSAFSTVGRAVGVAAENR